MYESKSATFLIIVPRISRMGGDLSRMPLRLDALILVTHPRNTVSANQSGTSAIIELQGRRQTNCRIQIKLREAPEGEMLAHHAKHHPSLHLGVLLRCYDKEFMPDQPLTFQDENEQMDYKNHRERAKKLVAELGITKQKFCSATGFSEDQYYAWFTSNMKRAPNADQMSLLCRKLDLAPSNHLSF